MEEEEYFCGFVRSSAFETLFHRLNDLERWKELAIRPQAIHPEDTKWISSCSDDDDDDVSISDLQQHCLVVRQLMNEALPKSIEVIPQWDDALVVQPSQIPGAGQGLFYQPSSSHHHHPNVVIPKGTTICYYTGHLHSFQSSQQIKDKSYLMMVKGQTLVDPGPCPWVKARYINDPLEDEAVNCMFQPQAYRSAVIATRDISPKEELFVSYGELYWSQQSCAGTRYNSRPNDNRTIG